MANNRPVRIYKEEGAHTMSKKMLLKKVNSLKDLEIQKKAIEKQLAVLQEEIKKKMEPEGWKRWQLNRPTVGSHTINKNPMHRQTHRANKRI